MKKLIIKTLKNDFLQGIWFGTFSLFIYYLVDNGELSVSFFVTTLIFTPLVWIFLELLVQIFKKK